MRKVRMKIVDKKQGKRGCARVAYYLVTDDDEIWLFDICDKAGEEKIPPKTLRNYLKDMIKTQEKSHA